MARIVASSVLRSQGGCSGGMRRLIVATAEGESRSVISFQRGDGVRAALVAATLPSPALQLPARRTTSIAAGAVLQSQGGTQLSVALPFALQRRWARVSSRSSPEPPEVKKSSGVRVRKQRQQEQQQSPQHESSGQGAQGDQSSGAPPPQAPVATQVANAPNPSAPAVQGRGGGVMGAIAEGMMHGVGWAFGQRAVDALMGPRTMEVVHSDNTAGGVPDSGGSPPTDGASFDGSSTPPPPPESPSAPADTNAYGPEGWQWGDDQSSHGGGGFFGGGDDGGGGGWFGGGDGDW